MEDTLKQIEKTLDEYFGKKAPALPANIKVIIVKLAPYFTIIFAILALPAIFFLIGLGGLASALSPMAGANGMSGIPTMWLGILLLIPVVVLEVMAIPGLFAKSAKAWKFLFWAQLITFVSNLVQLNIFGALIGGAIGFYFLFQVKSHYK